MSRDIEDFLRRAAQRRSQPPPPDIEILDADVIEDAEVIEEGIFAGEDVAAHVTHHMDTSAVGERLSHLADRIGEADDRMEAHLHAVFEHRLGELGAVTARAADSTLDDDSHRAATSKLPERPTTSFDLMALFGSPASLRDAIIVSEIINRPEHRW